MTIATFVERKKWNTRSYSTSCFGFGWVWIGEGGGFWSRAAKGIAARKWFSCLLELYSRLCARLSMAVGQTGFGWRRGKRGGNRLQLWRYGQHHNDRTKPFFFWDTALHCIELYRGND